MQIYNTLTRKKEEFLPADKEINIYVCGVTVYDDCHIGHGRSLYLFDVIRRYLKLRGYRVKFVRNITDIDDKIIRKAQAERGKGTIEEGWKKVAERYIESYEQDLKALGVEKGDFEPRATVYIPRMVDFIKVLLDKGFAYESQGSVYFRIRKYHQKFGDYGRLSGRDIEELKKAVRIEKDENKEDLLDFALWKKRKENEPAWSSPWSDGRPGWHIECSVMANTLLGETLDIHGGGKDLIFPHHENEIAQSQAYSEKPFSRFWVHNGLLNINSQKMSKSVGNFLKLSQAIEEYSADSLKLFYLSATYSAPLDFTLSKMREVERVRERLSSFLQQLDKVEGVSFEFTNKKISSLWDKFVSFMDDNFNLPRALSVLFELIEVVNTSKQESKNFFLQAKGLLRQILGVFSLFKEKKELPPDFIKYIEEKIKRRQSLRQAKEFVAADVIREELANKGIILEDKPDGTTDWRVK